MSLLVAPPEIFSAHAITTVDPARFGHWGVDRETYLPDESTFLRLYAGGGKSFPVAPFAVFKTFSNEEPLTDYTLEVHGGEFDPVSQTVTVSGGQDAWVGLNLPQYRFAAAVRLDLDVKGQLTWAQVYDQNGRMIDARNQPGWSFSAPSVRWLWLQGDAQVGVRIRTTLFDNFFGSNTPEGEEYTIGLPARFADEPFAGAEPHFTAPGDPGRLRWYLGLHDVAQGDARVRTAAPFTTNRMDSPTGPYFGTDQDGESNRVAARLKADERFWPRLFKLLHGDVPPWAPGNYDEAITDFVGPTTQSAHLPRQGMLQITAMDPGMAQFLGFSTILPGQVPDLPRMEGVDPALATGWDTLGAVGLFALDPDEVKHRLRVVPDPQQDELSVILLDMLARALGPRCGGGETARALLDEQIQQVRDLGAIPAVLCTFAAPVLPPRPPQLPVPQVVSHHWQQSTDGKPSSLYRAGFAFPRPPAVTLASIGRDNGDGPLTVHEPDGTGRVIPGIMGYEFEPNVRLRQLGQRKRVQNNAGLMSDQDIDAAWGEVRYYFSASDPFGRFGEPVECVVSAPERPKPRAPVMRSWIEPPGEADPPELPGRLRVIVAIPSPDGDPFPAERIKELGRAIVVPRIDELAAGSHKLVRLDLTFGDVTHQVDLDEPGFVEKSFDLPVLGVGGRDERILTGTFVDSNEDSASEQQKIRFFDRRPPATLATGFGLYWTSAPGPSPEVAVSLDWKGDPGSLYRVYLADSAGLGLPAGIDEAKSRGDVADAGCRRAIQTPGAIDPVNFRLLEKDAVVAGGDGVARYRGRLPRSISTVQFLKVVPVSKDGLEAKFSDAPIVPIAVPESRRPPLPQLDGEVDEATGRVRLEVRSDGFNRKRLFAEEAGLFAAVPSGQSPEFRVRRAFGAVVDPIYAKVVHSGPMKVVDREADIPVFKGTWSDGADTLVPFVRYTYWAEVRLPLERRGPTGLPLGAPGGLSAPDEVSRKDHPRPFSLVSAPRQLMWYPKGQPGPPQAVATRLVDAAGDVFVQLTLTDPPKAHRHAVGQYRLAVWWQWNAEPLQAVDNIGGAPLPDGGWPHVGEGTVTFRVPSAIDAGAAPLTVRIAYVDPLSRVGAIAKLEVAAA